MRGFASHNLDDGGDGPAGYHHLPPPGLTFQQWRDDLMPVVARALMADKGVAIIEGGAFRFNAEGETAIYAEQDTAYESLRAGGFYSVDDADEQSGFNSEVEVVCEEEEGARVEEAIVYWRQQGQVESYARVS